MEYDPRGSSVFLCDWISAQNLSVTDLQTIFRDRHILIKKGPIETINFDVDGLELLASVNAPIQLQGDNCLAICVYTENSTTPSPRTSGSGREQHTM
jgi:hypothetical protein